MSTPAHPQIRSATANGGPRARHVGSRAAAMRGLACCLALAAAPAAADPGYYVITTYPDAGRTTAELRYWTVESPGRATRLWPELGLFHGVNSRWTTGLLASWIGDAGAAQHLSTLNWVNEVLLTQGEWPLDVALHLQWIREAEAADGQALELGLVMQTDVGRTQLNLNLILERDFDNGRSNETRLKYQWQARHRWRPGLHLGLQGFGELGRWDRWRAADEQSHRAGPALFGTWAFDGERQLHWQAAYLWGRTYGRHGDMASLRLAWSW